MCATGSIGKDRSIPAECFKVDVLHIPISAVEIHYFTRTLAADFKYALAWGRSTKFSPQRVGLTHEMEDEDVIMIVKK